MLVSIEGLIGSGKSSLISKLSSNPKYIIVPEPLDIWQSISDKGGDNILSKFYKDQKRWAFSFQTLVYMSRIDNIFEAMKKGGSDKIYITERSIFADRNIFAQNAINEGTMDEIEEKMYNYMYETWTKMLSMICIVPTKIIWINTDPSVCFERIKKRNRCGEDGISIDYLEKLHTLHKNWLQKNELVLEINGNTEIGTKDYFELIENIEHFITNL